ncbi:MAG TPA: selenocysteine lyase [Bacteroidetes bacterium]|jgi:selenocysteine lyase/cysteine desulfurase|nr:MAG: selenocysteine lyase [Sphingobacteriales bacterium BACL12 MAG-120813-bin55]HCK22665.1 selenocysteine lyase [Bacteroidota bacterium]
MESHFLPFRKQIIGIDAAIETPYGQKPLVYADWTASGRMYGPIEEKLMQYVYPNVGNTHTDTSFTGSAMTMAYHEAIQLIKRHVGASKDDVLISSNSGMTGVVNKLQRILGLKVHERFRKSIDIPETDRPIVFCTHMEHHSNQTSWLETIADVEVIAPDQHGLVDLQHLAQLLEKYQNRKQKIAAITSYSNVTGIATPYHTIAAMMHEAGGLCFVDFACSAPYIPINMHPERPEERLDAIYFSPHKFLGGPGSSGIVIFNKALYNNQVPDHPGGGTVDWTNPWGEHKYLDDIELREDGGTPAFIPTMRVAMSIQLKEQMGVVPIRDREKEIVDRVWDKLRSFKGVHVLADKIKKRLPIFSFYIENLHFNLAVRILNDRFGIQTRGGCSCAGTYGHYLLHVDKEQSHSITQAISEGDYSKKPGWVRMSLHPTNTNKEIDYILDAIAALAENHIEWSKDYLCDLQHNNIRHKSRETSAIKELIDHIYYR